MLRIPIVFATDHNMIMATGVCIYSLLQHRGEVCYDIRLLIAEDVTENDYKLLQDQVKFFGDMNSLKSTTISCDFVDEQLNNIFKIPSYFRLLIPWLFPELDKVIYADVDIIFNTSLDNLFTNLELNDFFIAGVNNSHARDPQTPVYRDAIYLRIDPKKYINAGFLIFNSKLIRRFNFKDIILKLAKKSFYYRDQDIINLIFKNKIKYIEEEYNMSPDNIILYENINYKIIHYMGQKPWETFTYCWCEWWWAYRNSIFYDEHLYMDKMKDFYTFLLSDHKKTSPIKKVWIKTNGTLFKLIRIIKGRYKNEITNL